MRITVVYRDFWPDNSPYAQILFKIAKGLAASGHEVSVLTSFPSHSRHSDNKVPWSESVHGIAIRRLPLLPEYGRKLAIRLPNAVLFIIQFSLFLLFGNAELVLVASTPPVVDAAVVRFISRLKRFRYLYHCQDIHPEALLLAGKVKNGALYNLLRRIDKNNINSAAAAVVLSDDMKRTCTERGISGQNIHVINNFIFDSLQKVEAQDTAANDIFTVLFAGNLGQFQGLHTVIDAAIQLKEEKNIHFVFLGEGIERKSLEERAGTLLNRTIFFKGHRPFQEALKHMRSADLGLISLKPGVTKVAYPSKTMIYLSEGLPVLILAETDSSLAQFVLESKLGCVCEAKSPEKLADIIKLASRDKHQYRQDRERIKNIAFKTFGEDVIVKKWAILLNQLEKLFKPKAVQNHA